MSLVSLWGLTPETYQPHPLHRRDGLGADRAFAEANCYVDLWIELLHAQQLDGMACLPFTLVVDFEGDQWTFAKPPLGDLQRLYGVVVEELNVWRPLAEHARTQIERGHLVVTEADAFFLPDVQGTDYRVRHVKTTIALQAIDESAERLQYFHNGGLYRLSGEDFRGIFRLDRPPDPLQFALYAEIAKLDHLLKLPADELTQASLSLLREHLAHRPADNPISRFGKRFEADLDWLKAAGMDAFHTYAFATVRQLGAAFELGAYYLRWLSDRTGGTFLAAASDCSLIADGAKTFTLKLARAVTTKRPADFSPLFAELGAHWESAMGRLAIPSSGTGEGKGGGSTSSVTSTPNPSPRRGEGDVA